MAWGDEFVEAFKRMCLLTFKVHFQHATDQEIRDELEWSASREMSRFSGDCVADDTRFIDTLTENEYVWFQECKRIAPDNICCLAQNAFTQPLVATTPNMPTIICDNFPYTATSPELSRWLTPKQMPAVPHLSI